MQAKMTHRNRRSARRTVSGQAVVEYVIMLIMLILIALGVLSFSYYFFIYGERMTDSVSIEYP